ncbi:MAG: hypothetical protein K0S29_1306 [Gammaproteobacteria bacterium]|nr:hypothetical protein [Gammaproteobacteria bacterium]
MAFAGAGESKQTEQEAAAKAIAESVLVDESAALAESEEPAVPEQVSNIFSKIYEIYEEVIVDNQGVETDIHKSDRHQDSVYVNYNKFLEELKKLEPEHYSIAYKRDYVTHKPGTIYEFNGYLLSFALFLYDQANEGYPGDASHYAEIKKIEDIVYHILVKGIKRGVVFAEQLAFPDNQAILEKHPHLKDLYEQVNSSFEVASTEFPFQTQWMQSLNLSYGRRPGYAEPSFFAETDHYELMMQTTAYQKSERTPDDNPNTAFAGISFIVKDRNQKEESESYVKRYYFPIGEGEPLAPALMPDFKLRFDQRREKAEQIAKGLTREKRLVEKDNKFAPIALGAEYVDREVRHSEQAIFAYLEDPAKFKQLVDELNSAVQDAYLDDSYSGDEPLEIRAIVIHIHSHLYMCQNCQVSALGFQHPEGFMAMAEAALDKAGFEVSDKLVVPVVVSSHQPFPDRHKKYRMPLSEHQAGSMDIKRLQKKGVYLFAKDLTVGLKTDASLTPFSSRAKIATAIALERQISSLQEENQRLKDQLQARSESSGGAAGSGQITGSKREREDSAEFEALELAALQPPAKKQDTEGPKPGE